MGAVAVAAVVFFSSCLDSRSTRCGELYCPVGRVCAPDGARCVLPAAIDGCLNRAEADDCTLPGVTAAQCVSRVCTAVTCGDGITMRGEACDDGNTSSCDGCSSDCHSNETCGNGLVDCAEQCDDGAGNSLAPNAACRADCRRQRCGDAVVDDRSGEDCDEAPPASLDCRSLGFYSGTLGCSACRADVAACAGSCGDGVVNGVELCDGSPPVSQSCFDFGYDVGNLYCGQLCTPSFATCERLGFTGMQYSGQGLFINVLWGSARNDVFAGGYNGQILHFDGTTWASMISNADTTLYGLGGSGPSDVYAVGREGTLLHYDGMAWSKQVSGTQTQLNAVWASGPNDIFVGGRVETLPDDSKATLMLHSTGDGTWVRQTMPVRAGSDPLRIAGLWGSGPSDVFATAAGEIFHFDGIAWSLMEIPEVLHTDAVDLYAVWGTGPRDVFVVGDLGTILHYDGFAWSFMSSGTTTAFLNAIDGNAPDDVYIAAEAGLVLHYDGVAWSSVPSGTTQSLNGLSVKGDHVIVGGPGTLQEFKSGAPTISVVKTAMTGNVTGIWSFGRSNIIATSSLGEIYRFDGRTWADAQSGTTERLWSVWGSSPSDLFVVGDVSTILHSSGPATDGGLEWSAMVTPTVDVIFNWVWGTGPNDVYAVGSDGTLVHYDGASWSAIETGTTDTFLYAVWGSGPNDVFVVGQAGFILHFDGTSWARLDAGVDAEFWGVWGSGPNDVFFFADLEGVFHFDGVRFRHLSVRSSQSFNYSQGTSSSDAFAIEYSGQGLFHTNGTDWTSIRLPTVTTMSLFVTREQVYVGASEGNFITVDRNCALTENRCDDRWDNDCDGALNCQDTDCAGSAYCAAGGLCQTLSQLTCNSVNSGSTEGSSPIIERYGCASELMSGRERMYRFKAATTGAVTLELTSSEAQLNLIVLAGAASGGCDPLGACLASSPAQSGTRSVTFVAQAGVSYSVVVDGAAGAAGDFELKVGCQ